jgi:Acyl-CoA dehydrogenase, C-terminal domain
VPADHLIGKPGEGLKIAEAVLQFFRPTVGAAAVGFARRALQEALARSVERIAFKKLIAEHQLIQGWRAWPHGSTPPHCSFTAPHGRMIAAAGTGHIHG